jgi:hypothetical protein
MDRVRVVLKVFSQRFDELYEEFHTRDKDAEAS